MVLILLYCGLLTGAPEQSLRLALLLDLGGSGQNTRSFGGGISNESDVVRRDEQIGKMKERICRTGKKHKLKVTDACYI